MNENKRVAINAMATYGRTLLRMGLGLFSSRWVLESLGEVDYGLMGVVGVLIVLVTFLNSVVSGACSRFFAFSIGKNDVEDLVKWFNTGLVVHLSLAVILVFSFFSVGDWAIDNFLNIPPDRLETAHWVFRLSLISAFWTIASTPFIAMYMATQNIAEFTLWEVANILANFSFVYWLTSYTGNAWLVYTIFTVGLTLVLGAGQVIRAYFRFPGCKIRIRYWHNWNRLKEMLSFSGWSLFGNLGYLARAQFPPVLLNRFFNPARYAFVNASYQIGGALAGYTQSMSSSLLGAFTPQITTLTGANKYEEMVKTSLRASKFGTFLTILFAIPLALEADYLLVLWLKNPPILAADFCRIVLIQMIFDNLTFGHMAGIMASGQIKWYQLTTGILCMISIPVCWVVLTLGGGPLSVSLVIAGCMATCSFARLFFGCKLLQIQVTTWGRSVFLPILLVIIVGFVVGYLLIGLMPESSLLRLFLTSILTCPVMSFAAWYVLLDIDERTSIRNSLTVLRNKLFK